MSTASNPRKLRWWGVITLLLVVIISYVDRMNVSVLITNNEFLEHFGIKGDRIAQGELMSLFLIGYGIAAFFLSPLYETFFGVRKGLLISILIWAVMTIVSPVASSIGLLLLIRFILGASEGPLFSLKTMYIKDMFDQHERGKPNAVSSMGVSIGLAVGFPIVTYIILHSHWQASYVILGILNLIIGLPLILLFIKESGKKDSKRASAKPKSLKETFRQAWKTPGLVWILLIEIATLSYLWGSSSWLPAYLLNERHFSIKEMGILASLPFIFSIGSGYLGGYIIDRISPKRVSMLFVVGGLGTAISVSIAIFSASPVVSAIGLIVANLFWGIQGPAIPSIVQSASPDSSVGSTYGIVNGVGNLVSALMPTVMGAMIAGNGSESFTAGFTLLIGTQVLTVICAIVALRYNVFAAKEAGAPVER
ncbi:MFS transporter [Brevibacillus choshinensis]|uniref:MFS transporter n=1 Tax=Brevibacillus choshinensis TaxID=54911 RepID=A0ABX7FQF8_BRECH|nr:MFS transporter [Brevibacillus choshinensis]QRG68336.1 MFS transporter [Brevibacillus choshinensis]